MKITATNLTSGIVRGVNTFSTASISPLGNRVMLLSVSSNVSSGTPNVPVPSLAGWTFIQISSVTFGPFSSTVDRLTLFVGIGTGTGAISINFSSQTQVVTAWAVDQLVNVVTTGSGGGDCVKQIGTYTPHGTGYSITLSSFSKISNSCYAVCAKSATNSIAPAAPLSLLSENENGGSPGWGHGTMFSQINDTNPSATFGGSGGDDVGAIAIELVARKSGGAFMLNFLN